MASRIQGITVEIGGDTTKLQTALKGLNGEIKSTQTALKDVEKLLKMDPGNTELLAQKEKLLAQAVDETKQKLETLKTAAEQANTALANGDISQEQYDALQREIVETEQNLRSLETQANQSATAVQKIAATGESLKTTGDNISNAGKKLLPVTAAVTGLGTASVTTAANFESSMSQVQATMGITKDSMSNRFTSSAETAFPKSAKSMFTQNIERIQIAEWPFGYDLLNERVTCVEVVHTFTMDNDFPGEFDPAYIELNEENAYQMVAVYTYISAETEIAYGNLQVLEIDTTPFERVESQGVTICES